MRRQVARGEKILSKCQDTGKDNTRTRTRRAGRTNNQDKQARQNNIKDKESRQNKGQGTYGGQASEETEESQRRGRRGSAAAVLGEHGLAIKWQCLARAATAAATLATTAARATARATRAGAAPMEKTVQAVEEVPSEVLEVLREDLVGRLLLKQKLSNQRLEEGEGYGEICR